VSYCLSESLMAKRPVRPHDGPLPPPRGVQIRLHSVLQLSSTDVLTWMNGQRGEGFGWPSHDDPELSGMCTVEHDCLKRDAGYYRLDSDGAGLQRLLAERFETLPRGLYTRKSAVRKHAPKQTQLYEVSMKSEVLT